MALTIPTARKPYFAVITRTPTFPIIHGEHYGVTVADEPGDRTNVVFRTREAAEALLATLPQTYAGTDRAIGWEVASVYHNGDTRHWYDA